jgi:DNA mismatch repair protein MutS
MDFCSILFINEEEKNRNRQAKMPDYFYDLNIDQIIRDILTGREAYRIESLFYTRLTDLAAIRYRQEIMRDLENPVLYKGIESFTHGMMRTREYLAISKDLHNRYQQDRWLLEAASVYCSAVKELYALLDAAELGSTGLLLFRTWLEEYVGSDHFRKLAGDTEAYVREFNAISYSIRIDTDNIVIGEDDSATDYCAEINEIFRDINEVNHEHEISVFPGLEMCALESRILKIVSDMHKDTFAKLDVFYNSHKDFLSPHLVEFDREVQFYLAYLAYVRRLKDMGFHFTIPEFSEDKRINIVDGYDLALAKKLGDRSKIVFNDIVLDRGERIIVLTGPNQGGKTTYVRMFGQILFFASLGCVVPCRKATVTLFDSIHTLFPVEEDLTKNAGRLKEELVRLAQKLQGATSETVFLVNEFMTSTTTYDASTLGKRLLRTLEQMGCVCLYITHITELAFVSDKIVSMVAEVDTGRGEERTFRILRRPADGYVYVNPIVSKYRLSYENVKERLGR